MIPPKVREIAPWPCTNLSIHDALVLAGSESTITEITEYKYFSPLKTGREFKYKSEVVRRLDLDLKKRVFRGEKTHDRDKCNDLETKYKMACGKPKIQGARLSSSCRARHEGRSK